MQALSMALPTLFVPHHAGKGSVRDSQTLKAQSNGVYSNWPQNLQLKVALGERCLGGSNSATEKSAIF